MRGMMMRNIAASGAVNTRSLRAAKSSSMSKSGPSRSASSSAPAANEYAPRPSMAGYSGGRSTYVKTNDTGYGAIRDVRNKGIETPDIPDITPYRHPGIGVKPRIDNVSPGRYNPFRADSQLAKMLR